MASSKWARQSLKKGLGAAAPMRVRAFPCSIVSEALRGLDTLELPVLLDRWRLGTVGRIGGSPVERCRAEIPDGRVATARIAETFDVVEDRHGRLRVCVPAAGGSISSHSSDAKNDSHMA